MPSRTFSNPHQGDTATVLASSTETGGAYSLLACEVAPGGKVPPHFHTAFEEEIIAVDGPLKVTMGGEVRILQPGERVTVPRGVVHAWENAGAASATFHGRFTPGSTGFENFLRVVYGLARDGRLARTGLPRDFGSLALVIRWGDTNLPGPLRVLNPVLAWRARRAERAGLGEQLLRAYDGELPPPRPLDRP